MARSKTIETNTVEDQPIQVEVGDEEEIKASEPVEVPETETPEPPEPPPPPPEEADPAVLRERLKEQIRAEVLAEQARKDAETNARYQREIEAERKRAQEAEARAKQSDADSLVNAVGAAQAEADAAQHDYEAALASGDFKLQAETQRKLARAESRLDRLEEARVEYEARQQEQPQQRPMTREEYLEHQIKNLAEPAKAWFRQRPDYAIDPKKSQDVIAAHHWAIGAGHAELSPGYFEYVETSLGLRSRTAEAPRKERTTSVAAPVTREAPSSTGQRTPTRIELSIQEREVARTSKLTPNESDADAEKRYAKNKIRLMEAKRNGEIQ